jgi:hypothetical protein
MKYEAIQFQLLRMKALNKEGNDHLLHAFIFTMFVGYVTTFYQPVTVSWKNNHQMVDWVA